jgi:hypothetical protein
MRRYELSTAGSPLVLTPTGARDLTALPLLPAIAGGMRIILRGNHSTGNDLLPTYKRHPISLTEESICEFESSPSHSEETSWIGQAYKR